MKSVSFDIQTIHNLVQQVPLDIPEKSTGKKYRLHVSDNKSCELNRNYLKMFLLKGTKCVACGVEGIVYKTKQLHGDGSPHLQLWTADGILMTKDHIVPKSKGGPDTLDNLQPMCTDCNREKGDKLLI